MKKITQIFLICVSLVAFASFAKAQNDITDEKRQLISELITVMKVETQTKASMSVMFTMMESVYPISFKTSLDARGDLSTKQKERLVKSFSDSQRQFTEKFKEKLAQKINYRELAEEMMMPTYDKHFTANELLDLIAFYKSPTGQKYVDIMPEILSDSMKASQTSFLPKILKIVDEIIKEDIANLEQK
jgi:uncharacterized protein